MASGPLAHSGFSGGIEVEGAKETRRKLRDLEGGLKDLKAAHKEAAELVAKQAAFLVPVRKGRLQASIRASGTQREGVVRAGTARVPYAGPIHFGWPTRPNKQRGWRGGPIRPQPFIYDAMDRRIGEVLRVYEDRVEELIRRADLDR